MVLVEVGQAIIQEDWWPDVIGNGKSKRADCGVLLVYPIRWCRSRQIPAPLRLICCRRALEERCKFVAGNILKVGVGAALWGIVSAIGIVNGQFLNLSTTEFSFNYDNR